VITFSALGMLGRLGNQLFQIASTIGIAEKNGTHPTFPNWKYEKYFQHPLSHSPVINPVKFIETDFHYTDKTLKPDIDYNLEGFFQSPKYWNKETILKQFEFADTIKEKLSDKYKEAFSKPTVAISVRRGDFVNNPNYFQIPITYYLNAYYKHFGGYNVVIFSDDFEYCKTHFRAIPNVYYANENDIEQLCLMSLCGNHIISNSTFSWWGAYLSQSTNVIRPEKNFAGKLAEENSEKDYWPKEWKVFKDYQIDLSDTTFVIPVYYDHTDRKQNLMLTLSFLKTNFNTNIIVGEQGGNEFETLSEYAGYIKFNYPAFHRTKMINELTKMATTPIVVNWDCDNICTPTQLAEAVRAIRNGADISYPFDGTVLRTPRYLLGPVAETLDVFSITESQCVKKHSSVGHAVVMNKESFIKAGMENENFISWGPEDSERFNRYHILGLNIQRIPGVMHHIDHFIGENSSARNKFFHANENEFMKVATSKKERLQEYIKTWAWVS
jgi:hypothetical protein